MPDYTTEELADGLKWLASKNLDANTYKNSIIVEIANRLHTKDARVKELDTIVADIHEALEQNDLAAARVMACMKVTRKALESEEVGND